MYGINVTVLWLMQGLRKQGSNNHPAITAAQRSGYFLCTKTEMSQSEVLHETVGQFR